jgi:hypothetical protein
MTTVFNVIYKLSSATDIITGLSLAEGIKTVINIFIFVLSCGTPHLSRLK